MGWTQIGNARIVIETGHLLLLRRRQVPQSFQRYADLWALGPLIQLTVRECDGTVGSRTQVAFVRNVRRWRLGLFWNWISRGCIRIGTLRRRPHLGLSSESGNKPELCSRAELHIVSGRGEDGGSIFPLSHRDRKMRNSHYLPWQHGAFGFGATRLVVDGCCRRRDTPQTAVESEAYS